MQNGNKRKLVYWGAGDIGRLCAEQYPDVKPDFFIDSNRGTEMRTYCGVPVKTPDEIEDWGEIFVVITLTAIGEIEKILQEKKLVRNNDYARYKDFFSVYNESLADKVLKVESFMEKRREYEGSILIIAPVFISRVSKDLIHFFKEYGEKRRPHKCILLADLQVMSEKTAEEIMGYPVFDFSEICYWNGIVRPSMNIDISSFTHENTLTADEKTWILDLEERKTYDSKELSYKITAEIFWYFKNVFLLIRPSKVLIWSGWERQSCIAARLAQTMKIPFGYMEHGWIPGTVQFDKYWVDEQYKYASEPEIDLKIENKGMLLKQIKEFIIHSKIDTGKYRETEADNRSLQRIDKNKKTIFFAGTDDASIGFNPMSDYWKNYILPPFPSTEDAAVFIAEMCKKNNWNFVFKPHPNIAAQSNIDKLDSSIIQVKYTEIDRLIQMADVILSVTSKLEYKVLMYQKPLVKLGRSTLYKKGCCYEISDKTEIEPQVKIALKQGMTDEQNKIFESHLAQLLTYHLWDDLTGRELRYGLSLETDFFDV